MNEACLLLLLWACGQRVSVVHYVHSLRGLQTFEQRIAYFSNLGDTHRIFINGTLDPRTQAAANIPLRPEVDVGSVRLPPSRCSRDDEGKQRALW
jgi:hypothetical protein